MTKHHTNTRVQSLILGSCICFAALLPATASAETQVKLQSLSNTLRISEGYKASVEQWQALSSAYDASDAHNVVHYHHDDADVWVDDVGTSLFADHDHDGYFGGFSLSFDVDAAYGERDVYASIYLQLGDDSPVALHTTEVFSVYSRSGADIYRVEAELVDNYPAGEYNVQIDILDAHNGDLLDSVDQSTFRNLRNLPLEAEPYSDDSASVIITEYAGMGGPALLILLALTALLRRGRGRHAIIGEFTALAQGSPDRTHYEQLPDTKTTGHRLPF